MGQRIYEDNPVEKASTVRQSATKSSSFWVSLDGSDHLMKAALYLKGMDAPPMRLSIKYKANLAPYPFAALWHRKVKYVGRPTTVTTILQIRNEAVNHQCRRQPLLPHMDAFRSHKDHAGPKYIR